MEKKDMEIWRDKSKKNIFEETFSGPASYSKSEIGKCKTSLYIPHVIRFYVNWKRKFVDEPPVKRLVLQAATTPVPYLW